MTIRAGASLTLAAIDALLRPHSLSIGPFPDSLRARTLAEVLEGPWAGLHAIAGGRLEPWCTAVAAVLPDGRRFETSHAPRSAAGPELSALLLGAGGRFARVVEATLRCRPLGDRTVQHAWAMRDIESGLEHLRRALAEGAAPWNVFIDAATLRCSATLVGTMAGIERDRVTLGPAAPPLALRPLAPALHECTWAEVGVTLREGASVRLHRLSLATVVVEGGTRGLSLDGPVEWPSETMQLLEPDRAMS